MLFYVVGDQLIQTDIGTALSFSRIFLDSGLPCDLLVCAVLVVRFKSACNLFAILKFIGRTHKLNSN